MILLQDIALSDKGNCPYFHDRDCQFGYFFAHDLNGTELERLLSLGWRKFGLYFFRPQCECRECVPMRILAKYYRPSKEQRRIARKNSDVKVRFSELEYRDELFDIYCDHSLARFGKITDSKETFINSFFMPSSPSMLSEFYLDGHLVAVGFVDISDRALSSVYFIYRSSVAHRRMGTFGMIREIEYAREANLDYYYPGYYIENNARMNYKGRFHPAQFFDWDGRTWRNEGEHER